MRAVIIHTVLIGLFILTSFIHTMSDTGSFGVFSAILMLGLGISHFIVSIVQVRKDDSTRRIFGIHLVLSVVLIFVIVANNRIDIDDFANFSGNVFLLRVAPGILAGLFAYGLFLQGKVAGK